MKMKNKYYNYVLGSLCFLMAALSVSCSEEIFDDKEQIDNATVTFEVGIDASIMTRATGSYGSVSDYTTTAYVFSRTRNVDNPPSEEGENFYENFTFVESANVGSSLFTYDITEDKLYLFVFVACENPYAEKGLGKVVIEDNYDIKEIEVGTEFKNCFIRIFSNDDDNTTEGYCTPHPKAANAKDDFMVFGAAHQINGIAEGNYKPEKITLTRQLGAVVFKAGPSTEKVTCKVASEYYRLYLSQMCGEAAFSSLMNDFAGNKMVPLMSRDFDGNNDGTYTFYLPCTTTEAPSETSKGQANVVFDEGWIGLVETSITTNGVTYTLDEDATFPISPNYKTILTTDDGSRLNVSFSEEDGGINLEDEWNGMD